MSFSRPNSSADNSIKASTTLWNLSFTALEDNVCHKDRDTLLRKLKKVVIQSLVHITIESFYQILGCTLQSG